MRGSKTPRCGRTMAGDCFFTATGTIGSLFEQSLSGTDPAQLLLQTDEHKVPTSVSPDGRFLLYTAMSPRATRFDLWVLPLKGDRKPFPFVRREFDQLQGQFSPDGRWVAYVSNESGRHEVLVGRSRLPARQTRSRARSCPRVEARRRAGGQTAKSSTISGRTEPSHPLPSHRSRCANWPQRVLFQVPGADADWAVTRDGERFLLAVPAGRSTPSPFTVVFNWQAAVNR